MKIFGWISSRNGNKKQTSASLSYHSQIGSCNQEFSDWPHGLLTIGTFGIKEINENSVNNPLQEIEPEESKDNDRDAEFAATSDLTLDTDVCKEDSCSQNETCVVLCEEKGLNPDKNTSKNLINKKSFKFLLKKMIACGATEFIPTPRLADQVPESKMEKILRKILHRKIYPQVPKPTMPTKKYLESHIEEFSSSDSDSDDDYIMDKTADGGSKWVKTDSEFIVLEM